MKTLHVKKIKLDFESDTASLEITKEIKAEKEKLTEIFKNHVISAGNYVLTEKHVVISFEISEKRKVQVYYT